MAPRPTGSPHVGLARTALFNWAFARHHGGTFVFRIEDTDKERNTQESLRRDDRRHGAGSASTGTRAREVGGPYGPYRQCERTDIYRDVLARLRESAFTYDCFCTTEEVDARRKASGSKVHGLRRLLPRAVRRAASRRSRPRAAGRSSASGCPTARSPGPTWSAATITFETEFVPDFALCRANGDPLYTLVNPVDDALMEITHVLRGEDLLSSTPAPDRAATRR